MASDDRAIVVGIDTYPDIAPLQGPEADADDFYDWLTSPKFGDVPPTRVEKIVSTNFAADPRKPTEEISRAFDKLLAEGVRNNIPRKIGRRLYVYVAGHGVGLPMHHDPEHNDAALLLADASNFNPTHVMTRVRALYFLYAGLFEEIAVFMDCCRQPLSINPVFPSYITAINLDALEGEPRKFFAFATKWGLTTRERSFDGETRGVFTRALTAGLRGSAANPDGTITSSSLRDYLMLNMKDQLSEDDRRNPDIPKRPHIPTPDVELVFATVDPPRVKVTVTFPAAAANQNIRVFGDGFRDVATGNTGAGPTWEIPVPLERGGYFVQVAALNLDAKFRLVGDEGTLNVNL